MVISSAWENQVKHQVVLSYINVKYFYIDCIIVIRRPDDGH